MFLAFCLISKKIQKRSQTLQLHVNRNCFSEYQFTTQNSNSVNNEHILKLVELSRYLI